MNWHIRCFLLGKKTGRAEEFGCFAVEVSDLSAWFAFTGSAEGIFSEVDDDLRKFILSPLCRPVCYTFGDGDIFELFGFDDDDRAVGELWFHRVRLWGCEDGTGGAYLVWVCLPGSCCHDGCVGVLGCLVGRRVGRAVAVEELSVYLGDEENILVCDGGDKNGCDELFDVAVGFSGDAGRRPDSVGVFLEGDAVIRASAASQRIGSVGDLSNINPYLKAISDRWYTRLVMTSPAPLMELERNAEFIRNLSALDFAANRSYLPQLVDLPDRLKISSPYFIVFPGASRIGRRWPVAHFLEVTTQLHLVYGWLPVLCGGTSETLLCQKIADLSTVPMLNLGGATSLPELVELLRGACLLITNETSALHLAAAVSTPTVGIVGGGHFGRFMPYPDSISGIKPIAANHEMSCYGCNWQCSQIHDPAGPVPCIRDVSVKRVLELVSLQNKDSGIIQVAE